MEDPHQPAHRNQHQKPSAFANTVLSHGNVVLPTPGAENTKAAEQPPTPSRSSRKTALKPSAAFVAEMQTAQISPTAPPHSATGGMNVTHAEAVRSVYPDATRRGIMPNPTDTAPGFSKDTKDTRIAVTFADGYAIGGSIFWYQLITGLALGLFSYGVLKVSKAPDFMAALYVIEYLILLYVTYTVLKDDAATEPLWLTFFGMAAQSVIVAATFWLFDALLFKIVFSQGSSPHFGLGVSVATPMLYVGTLVATYFLAKLSWGAVFSLFGKIKNKLILRAIGVGLIAIFVGSITYHFITLTKSSVAGSSSNISLSSIQPAGLTTYNVAGSPAFSVRFYKGSQDITGHNGPGDLLYTAGPGAKSVSISVANGPPINVQTPNYCYPSGTESQFSFTSQGSTGYVCTARSNTLTSYTGHTQEHGKNYVINMSSSSEQLNPTTVTAIFNSIVIE